MRDFFILGMAVLGLVACADVTRYTGLTAEQQQCIGQTLVAIQADPAAKDLRIQQKAALIADSCQVSIDKLLLQPTE